jgi:hypothetical protein
MDLPRDSKGRFKKRAASVPSGAGAVSPSKPCKKNQSKVSAIVETEKIMRDWQQKYEYLVDKHEAQVAAMVARYEQSLTGIAADLSRVAAQQEQLLQAPSTPPVTPPPVTPPPQRPSAIWIEAEDGENLMLINQAAAVMFLAIFGRMQDVIKEFQKMVPATPKR